MEELIRQIREANSAGLYYLALFAALALPDMCGALEAADGRANDDRYKDWFDCHVGPKYNGLLDGDTCYLFRCAMLHQGRMQHPGSRWKIVFFDPAASATLHRNILYTQAGDILNIDVKIFCEDVASAAEMWLSNVRQLPRVAANLEKSVKRYRNGLQPFIKGDVIA
jgi:hypothetical protein